MHAERATDGRARLPALSCYDRAVKAAAMLLLLAFVPTDVDAKCAPSSLRASVVTPAGTVVTEEGGIVVAAVSFFDGGNISTGDVVQQKGWRFRHGNLLVEPTIEIIAPGLAVYRYPAVKDKLELEDDKHAVLATLTVTKDRVAVLAAPKVKKIVSTKSYGKRPSTSIEVALDGAAPTTAVAIVAVDAKGKAIAFGTLDGTEVVVFSQQRCDTVADGTREPLSGEKISVFWLDATGRKSPASKPVAVTGLKVVNQ